MPISRRAARPEVEVEGDVFAERGWGKRLRVFVRGNDLDVIREFGERVRRTLEDRALFPEIDDVNEVRNDERNPTFLCGVVRFRIRRLRSRYHRST